MTLFQIATERRPLVIGVTSAVSFHVLLLMAFALVYLDVSPMTTPPLEVELMGALTAPEVPSESRTEEASSVPEPHLPAARTEPIPAPKERLETEEPVPDLPEIARGPLDPLAPPPIPSTAVRQRRSPSRQLSPLPISSADSLHARESRVQVRVEGMLRARRLVHMINPVFPKEQHVGGVVKVRLDVDQDGTVSLATVVQKADPALDRAALDALKQWRFARTEADAVSHGIVTVDFVVQ